MSVSLPRSLTAVATALSIALAAGTVAMSQPATAQGTPVPDLASPYTWVEDFDSPEALLEYKKRIHAESAEKRER